MTLLNIEINCKVKAGQNEVHPGDLARTASVSRPSPGEHLVTVRRQCIYFKLVPQKQAQGEALCIRCAQKVSPGERPVLENLDRAGVSKTENPAWFFLVCFPSDHMRVREQHHVPQSYPKLSKAAPRTQALICTVKHTPGSHRPRSREQSNKSGLN